MCDPTWKPVSVEDGGHVLLIHYRNKSREEYIHTADPAELDFWDGNPHRLCWSSCSGDWPGCKTGCPLIAEYYESIVSERRRHEIVPPVDPFGFILNRDCTIDDDNFYIESFDTVDGAHWEIALDVSAQILQYLDEQTAEGI